ncbi:Arc family DNA-binding protein [Acinetobacter pragensis]|uniref:DNA-binding protein n=1 Tax=Acinetobacter pragensis TaxID=1806892 RepID=A0A151Y5K6_9GAMM|nr:Arc family DNA-binding protein [Acinetobacter pragensis]KYQ73270.1 DNA-binding protein [Acinetobacter pragensis]
MARTDPQFNLRVPIELKQQVENAAKESGRSINAEAVFRLEQSFRNEIGYLESVPLEKLLAVVMKKLGENSIRLTSEEIERGERLSKKSDEN